MIDDIINISEKIKQMTENEVSLNNLSIKLGISECEILGIINLLKNKGNNIILVKKDDDIYLLNQGEINYSNNYEYKFSSGLDNKISFLIISDTRFGSICFQKSILNELYLNAFSRGIKNVILTGNITEGLYKMSNNMIDTLVVKDSISQAKYVIDNFPYIEGINTYFITGKKDQTHLKENKIDIGRQISSGRSDMHYIGNGRCTIYVDNVKILLLNRNQIKTYTQSYRAQKVIDAMRSEDKPDILLYGGLLQSDKYSYRDVKVLTIPSVCSTTWEMEDKEYSNTIGGWYADIYTDKFGNLVSFNALNNIYYASRDFDCNKAKTLRIVRKK